MATAKVNPNARPYTGNSDGDTVRLNRASAKRQLVVVLFNENGFVYADSFTFLGRNFPNRKDISTHLMLDTTQTMQVCFVVLLFPGDLFPVML